MRSVDTHTRWTPDGKGLVCQKEGGAAAEICVLDLEGDAERRRFLQTAVHEPQPDLSPDGRYIVYHSRETGGTQRIFVQSFTGPASRRQISTEYGSQSTLVAEPTRDLLP